MTTTWKEKWCEKQKNRETEECSISHSITTEHWIFYCFSVPLVASSFGFSIHEK